MKLNQLELRLLRVIQALQIQIGFRQSPFLSNPRSLYHGCRAWYFRNLSSAQSEEILNRTGTCVPLLAVHVKPFKKDSIIDENSLHES